MKNYGLKTIIFIALATVALISGYIMLRDIEGMALPFTLATIVSVYALINAPLASISDKHIKVASLNPFFRNIDVPVANADKVIIDIDDRKFRMTLHMKGDDSYRSIRTIRFHDMKPIYYALRKTNLPIETNGVGTIDWA